MTDSELVARFIGYQPWSGPTTEDGMKACERMPDFANDANAWPPVYEELERRGLYSNYVFAILPIVRTPGLEARLPAFSSRGVADWCLITATPAQRLAAMMKVLEEVES